MNAVYKLGKITNPHIIIDILGFAEFRDHAGIFLTATCKMLRKLLHLNFIPFQNLTVDFSREKMRTILFC